MLTEQFWCNQIVKYIYANQVSRLWKAAAWVTVLSVWHQGTRLAVESVHHRFCHSGLWHETRLVFWSGQRNTSRLTSKMLQSSGNLLGLVLLSFTSKLQKKWKSCKMVFSFAERHLDSSPGSSLADRKHPLSISWLCWGGRYIFFFFSSEIKFYMVFWNIPHQIF